MVRTCTLTNWNPRPACGAAFSSVCISISVVETGVLAVRVMETGCRCWALALVL